MQLPAPPNFLDVVVLVADEGLGEVVVEEEEEEEEVVDEECLLLCLAIHQGTIVTVSSIPDSSVDDDADTYDTCAWIASASWSMDDDCGGGGGGGDDDDDDDCGDDCGDDDDCDCNDDSGSRLVDAVTVPPSPTLLPTPPTPAPPPTPTPTPTPTPIDHFTF